MKYELLQRIENLSNAAAWSLENGGLTSGQRICLHQERANCLKVIAAIENGEDYLSIEKVSIGANLEQKVQHILAVIKNTNWEKQEVKY